jgi:alpha-beta hydrolase superfamily lysophospholipase
MLMTTQRLTFLGATGARRTARLDIPDTGPAHAYALFAHCLSCSNNRTAAATISRALNDAGIAVLRYDFTGPGESEANAADTDAASGAGDLVAAATFLAESYAPPALLVGHSLGGAAVLQTAAHIPSVRAVATIGAPSTPGPITRLLANAPETIAREGCATLTLAGRQFRITKQFLDDLAPTVMERTIHGLRRALLICHAARDAIVGIDNAARIEQAAHHPKSFLALADGDHLLSNPRDAAYTGRMVAAWAARYLPELAEQLLSQEPRASVVVRAGCSC